VGVVDVAGECGAEGAAAGVDFGRGASALDGAVQVAAGFAQQVLGAESTAAGGGRVAGLLLPPPLPPLNWLMAEPTRNSTTIVGRQPMFVC